MFVQILLFCTVVMLISIYHRFSYVGRLMHKIPGPRSMPLIGNSTALLQNRENLFEFVREMHQKYGDITKVHGFFVEGVNLYSPDDFEVILSSTKFSMKGLPYLFLRPWLGRGLLLNNGKKWHRRRKLLTPAFHFNILKKFTRTFNEQATEMVESIQSETVKDRTEIESLIMKHTLRIMCETAMGTKMHEDINSVSSKYLTAIHILGHCVIGRIARAWLYNDTIFRFSELYRKQKDALKDLHKFTKQIIQERRESRQNNEIEDLVNFEDIYGKKSRVALLDILLDQEQQCHIDEGGIREEVDTFMFEGHDTISTALCFMVMRIANEPEAQRKIHEELDRVFGDTDREPTIEDLAELKYLECCIKESMRLYPSVPFIARYITEDVILSGYKVPRGTICSLNIFDVHRRADIYPEPEQFRPDRFLPENVTKLHPFAYLPFSAGPRNCIGQKFALLEMKTLMSGMLRRYCLEPITKPRDCQFVCDIVLRAKNPIYVRFCKRKKD